jgi:hypothetical protein
MQPSTIKPSVSIDQPAIRVDLAALTPSGRMGLKEAFKSLLESEKPLYEKTDTIALAITEVAEKERYLSRQIGLMQQLKKRLKEVSSVAKSCVAELMQDYGVKRLEGAFVSSITLQPAKRTVRDRLVILDREALMKLGYVKVELDEEALYEAMQDKEAMEQIAPYVSIETESTEKPATIRINARKSQAADLSPMAA